MPGFIDAPLASNFIGIGYKIHNGGAAILTAGISCLLQVPMLRAAGSQAFMCAYHKKRKCKRFHNHEDPTT